jgi:hypothetical protein
MYHRTGQDLNTPWWFSPSGEISPGGGFMRCGLKPGDRVLVAAVPADETLTAYPLAVVHEAILARGVFPHAHGGQP